MIVVVLSLLVLLSVPLAGGDLSRVRELDLKAVWIPPLAIVAQTLAVGSLAHMAAVAWGLHASSYAIAVAFLWVNRAVPGLWLAGSGGLMNLAAIGANGGVMPALPQAVELAGIPVDAEFANSAASSGSPLWFLGDVFAIPGSWPFANVFSVGDVVLVIGLAIMLRRLCRRTPADEPAPAPAA